MRNQNNQRQIWQKEHTSNNNYFLPGHSKSEVTNDVVYFYNYISKLNKNILSKNVIIDIGAGKGRNSLFLLEKGFKVYATDFIQEALEELKERSKVNSNNKNLKVINCEIHKKWPFPNNYFDFAIDSLSSIDIDGYKERCSYKKELFRTLKPGGLVLFRCVSSNDKLEKKLMKKYPGKEINSSIWPGSKKFQKNYSYDEIRRFYSNFNILELTEYVKKAIKMGKEFEATNFRVILEKPTI